MRAAWLCGCLLVSLLPAVEEAPAFVDIASSPEITLAYAADPSGSGAQFRVRDRAGVDTVIKSDDIDPFFNAERIYAGIRGDRALIAGLTSSCSVVGVLNVGAAKRVERVLPVLFPTMDPARRQVAFLSWQDRSNANTQTAVINVWQLSPTGISTRVVYPPGNAGENNPQPWCAGSQDPINTISPLCWNADGTHLGFVVRVGSDFVYQFIDMMFSADGTPLVHRRDLALGTIFEHDPKLFLGGTGLMVKSIVWNKADITLAFDPRPYLKTASVTVPQGKEADFLDPKRLLAGAEGAHDAHLLGFEKSKVDLGALDKKMHRAEFRYTNASSHEVAILSLTPTCTCLTLEEFDRVIPPKGTGTIGVWVDMSEATGPLTQSIIALLGSADDVQSLRLTIHGTLK